MLLSLFVLTGCATAVKPMLVAPANSRQPAKRMLAGNKVLIVAPAVTYLDVKTEQVISTNDHPLSQAVSKSVVSRAQDLLSRHRFEVVQLDQLKARQEESRQILSELSGQSGVLVRPRSQRRAQLLSRLQALKTSGVDAILIHAVDVKMGSAATFDYINSGNMTASTSSGDIRAGLIDTSTGDLIWDREVYHRDKVGPDNVGQLLDLLYSDFSVEAGTT